jgi:hypothetical protein
MSPYSSTRLASVPTERFRNPEVRTSLERQGCDRTFAPPKGLYSYGNLRGDIDGLTGDASGVWGNASFAIGDVTGISGDLTGFRGDVAELKKKQAKKKK